MTAMCCGTHTCVICRLGSGLMTVLPLKSTRLPLRLPLKRPCLPLSLCTKPRRGLPGVWNCRGSPGRSLLMSMAACTCRKSQFSIRFWMGSPRSRPWRSTLFTSMICMSFMVMSSSLLVPSISTEGRMATGGTARWVTIRFSGRPVMSSTSQSESGMCVNSSCTRSGFRSSAMRCTQVLIWSLYFMASDSVSLYASSRDTFLEYFSCTILRAPVVFLTVPL
mmetsp:Transcript_9614/g.20489  ORF Transcript_9614/g.20489 Transcript_9614/m.20489 type:complete len:221 (-) Transcript_9614:515-1177(-)